MKKPKQPDLVLEERARQAIADVRAVMRTPEGRRFYWRVLMECGVFGSSFSESAAKTAYFEGRRSVGIALMKEVQTQAPADHVLTLNEQLALQREDESRRRANALKAETENGD